MTNSNATHESRVHEWVQKLYEEGNELHDALANNFTYYLDHVDELENGALHYTDLPEFNKTDKAVMHAAIMAGISWGNQPLHVITDPTNRFIAAFGFEENATKFAQTTPGYSTITTTPAGVDVQDDIAEMKAGESDILRKVGACIEHLLAHESEFENGDSKSVIDEMPHFDANVKWLIALSTLFGRLWEFSDPALWVVLGENDSFEGLYGTPRTAAAAAQEHATYRAEAITPRDNDRVTSYMSLDVL